MEKVSIKASVRKERGKNACKHLRKEGLLPAIIYKKGEEGLSVCVDKKELWHVLHTEAGENVIITLEISDDGKQSTKTVIVQEKQDDPIKDIPIHVDFHEISLTEKIKVKVPVGLKGEAVGVKEDGVLNQVLWEVEVECMAMEIPERLEVNIENLGIGDAIHVKDIERPEEVHILDDPEQVVVGVNPPHVEEVVEEEAEEAAEEPELIKKGKKEEEEAETSAEGQ